MTRNRDIERVLDRFYAEGPTEMPDRLFLGVVDRIERVPQRRLAYRMTRFTTMSSNLRLAAAAAVVVAVAGIAAFAFSQRPDVATQPTPSPSTLASATTPSFVPASLPAALRGRWVGASRNVPEVPEPPSRIGLRISGGDLQFDLDSGTATQFASTALVVAPSQIRLVLASTDGGCQPRGEGTYDFALSPDSTVLTLTAVADQCGPRTAALAGDWIRAACPDPQAWCLGDIGPGAHVSTFFTPLVPPSDWQYRYGAFSYTVPAGWANTADFPDGISFAQQDAPENTGIYVWSNVVPHSQADMCTTTPEPGVGRDAAAIATWLTTLPGLVTTEPAAVTIGGLSGLMVELSVAPTWTATCPYAATPGQPLVSTFSAPTAGDGIDWNIQAEGRTRVILLDLPDGHALVIDIEGQNKADYDALLPEAMQVVNSFVLNP